MPSLRARLCHRWLSTGKRPGAAAHEQVICQAVLKFPANHRWSWLAARRRVQRW
jgi:hypothetical protein